jgi:hypothetical protein
MALTIACPECGQTLQVPEELIGKAVQCPQCQHAFVASKPAEAKKPEPAPAEVKAGEPPFDSKHNKAHEHADDDLAPIKKFAKPDKVTAMGLMALLGGIWALLLAAGASAGTIGGCCLWPGTYYCIVVGIIGIIRGVALLGDKAAEERPPKTLAILMIVNIINGDVVSLTLGIIMAIFCSEHDVIKYLRKPA